MWSVLLFSHPRRKYLSFVLANSAPCTCFPLRLSPLRRSLLGHSSSGVSPEFHKSDCFSQKHLDDTPLSSFLLPFVCPFPCLAIPYFTYLFFFHSTQTTLPHFNFSVTAELNDVRSILIILINEEINKANRMISNSAKLDRRTKQHTQFGVSESHRSRDMVRIKSWRKK